MSESTVVPFKLPSEFSPDPLTEVLQTGARELLAAAVRAELAEFLGAHEHLHDEEGRQRLVRHGFLPEREMMTGIGAVPVQVPRMRDRGKNADGSRIRFTSSIVPPYLRKTKSVERQPRPRHHGEPFDGQHHGGAFVLDGDGGLGR